MQVALYKKFGYTDIFYMTPVALRDRPETHPLIGYLVNAGLVRRQINPEGNLSDEIVGWSTNVHEIFENTLPHGILVRAIPGLRPHIQVGFQHIHMSDFFGKYRIGTTTATVFEPKSQGNRNILSHAKMELFFWTSPQSISIEYFAELFQDSTIQDLIEYTIQALKEVQMLG